MIWYNQESDHSAASCRLNKRRCYCWKSRLIWDVCPAGKHWRVHTASATHSWCTAPASEVISCFPPDRAAGKQGTCRRSFSKVPGDLLANQLYGHRRQPWVSHVTQTTLQFPLILLNVFNCAPPSFLLLTESTDDDKVVAWHWEEVKGPLREEKVIADTPVLTLTNLVPGNYTFRYGFQSQLEKYVFLDFCLPCSVCI